MQWRRMTTLILAFGFAGCATAGPDEDVPKIFLEDTVSSLNAHESLDYISAQEDYFIFTRAALNYSTSAIFHGWIENGEPKIEQLPISDSGYDVDPAITPNRDRVIFTSTRISRLNPEENWNLWAAKATFEEGRFHFSAPTPLELSVNSPASECCAVFLNETDFLFSSDRGGNWDIYQAVKSDNGYVVEPLAGALNSDHGEWPNQYLQDRDLLVFSSIRPGGKGGDDIYVSQKAGDQFNEPVLLQAPVNSDTYEDNALIENGQIYWSRRRSDGSADAAQSDIIFMSLEEIEALRERRPPAN